MIDEPEGDKTLLVESLPRADSDCRIRQEYVCDLCHRVLGRHSEEARRHMAKYQHPSVSWCNTVSHRNQVRYCAFTWLTRGVDYKALVRSSHSVVTLNSQMLNFTYCANCLF